MFENYQNMSTEYVPNNYLNCCNNVQNQNILSMSTNLPFEVKDARGNLIGYFWYYGNSVQLLFDIDGTIVGGETTYLDVDSVLSVCNATITIYDSRYNIVHQLTIKASKQLEFSIDSELSHKLLRGTYTISLVVSNDTGYNLTLFSTDTCVFEVR